MKEDMEVLLYGEMIHADINEEIEYGDLDGSLDAVWRFLPAMGCLRVETHDEETERYALIIKNGEAAGCWRDVQLLIQQVPGRMRTVTFLFSGKVTAVNTAINHLTLTMFTFFDTEGKETEEDARNPERF